MGTRRERVILELESNFASQLARDAAAVKLFQQTLDGVNTKTGPAFTRTAVNIERDTRVVGNSIDRLSGRVRLIAQAVGALGPALSPIAAAAVPAITGLTMSLGSVALGAGVVVSAFQGVGDAMKAVRAYELEPTTANLEKMQLAMQQLSPAAQDAVRAMREFAPILGDIRDTAAAGFFPGFTEGLETLETLAPRIEAIFGSVAEASGELFAGAAAELSGPEWEEFFAFIEREAAPTLTMFAQTVGNFGKGFAELFMALDPLTDGFNRGLLDMSKSFESWAEGLSATEGFQEFLDYVRETGPQVLETLGSLANMVIQIGQAAAPLGGPVLKALEAVADAVAEIADSPLGPPILAAVTAMSALRLATQGWAAVSRTAWATNIAGANGYAARLSAVKGAATLAAAGIGALALNAQESATGFDASNTAMGLMVGALAGPWGLAVGGGIGLLVDLTEAADDSQQAIAELNSAIASGSRQQIVEELNDINAARQALVDSANNGELDWSDVTSGLDQIKAAVTGGETQWERYGRAADEASDELIRLSNVGDHLGDQVFPVLASSLGIAEGEAHALAATAAQLNDQLRQMQGILDKRGALRNYEDALRGIADAVEDNGKSLDITTEKGSLNQRALDDLARSVIDVAEKLKGTARVEFLKQARADLIDARAKFNGGREAAEEFVNRFKVFRDLLDKGATGDIDIDDKKARGKLKDFEHDLTALGGVSVEPKVGADTSRGKAKLDDVFTDLFDLDRSVASPRVNADISGALRGIAVVRGQLATLHDKEVQVTVFERHQSVSADGGTVPKTGLPYADRHHYLLADGEEVISNRHGQADRWRPLLKAINAGRLADGGTVASRAVAAMGPSIDYGRLADAVVARSASLSGLGIRGTLDLGDGVRGVVRGVVREELDADREFDRVRSGR